MLLLSLAHVALAAESATITIIVPSGVATGCDYNVLVKYQYTNGTPIPGATINLGVVSPGNTSTITSTVTTNATGFGVASYHASMSTGINNITGTAALNSSIKGSHQFNVAAPASVTLTASPGFRVANNASTSAGIALVTDSLGNPLSGVTVNFTATAKWNNVTQSVRSGTAKTGVDGKGQYVIGPYASSVNVSVVAEMRGMTSTSYVRFVNIGTPILQYPASAITSTDVTIMAVVLDSYTPAAGIPMTVTAYYYNGSVLKTETVYTNETGIALFGFTICPQIGYNIVVFRNYDLTGNLATATIMGVGDTVDSFVLTPEPASPILADGVSTYKLKIWAKDKDGNPSPNEVLTVRRNNDNTMLVTTNSWGYAEVDIGASKFVGDTNIEVEANSNLVKDNINLSYIAGPPSRIILKGNPAVVASSEIDTPPGMLDVHSTEIIGTVTDQWYHPLEGQPINISSSNVSKASISIINGTTDMNGEFYTMFTLLNGSYGIGTVRVNGNSKSLNGILDMTYTNKSFLAATTVISPKNVSVNDTIDVNISVRAFGWKIKPQPMDVMLVIDKSGSMYWNSNTVYPANGTPLTGYVPNPNTWYKVCDYTNYVSGKPIQIFLSSSYRNISNPGSTNDATYYELRVKDPCGNNYTASGGDVTLTNNHGNSSYPVRWHSSVPENLIQFDKPIVGKKYEIWAKYHYDIDEGPAPYNIMVVKAPSRLGTSTNYEAAAKVAAIGFVNNLSSTDKVGLVSYSTNSNLDKSLRYCTGTDKSQTINRINGLGASGGTNTYLGIRSAVHELNANSNASRKKVIILLSDGYSYDPDQDLVDAGIAGANGITIFTIGIGMPDHVGLDRIAKSTPLGNYSYATSDVELINRYAAIYDELTKIVARTGDMSVVTNSSVIDGLTVPDAQYINNSAVVRYSNGTSRQVEPAKMLNSSKYSLSWGTGPVPLNGVWTVNYKLKLLKNGSISPILENSTIRFTREDNSTDIVYFGGEMLYVQDDTGGGLNTSTSRLSVLITTPSTDNVTVLQALHQPIVWMVTYSGNRTYNQTVYMLMPDKTTWEPLSVGSWIPLTIGYNGNKNSIYTFIWKTEMLPSGNYSICVKAEDSIYEALDYANVTIPYKRGNIVLE